MSCVVIEDVEEVEVISIVEPTYDYYVSKKGETLWDIAGVRKFMEILPSGR